MAASALRVALIGCGFQGTHFAAALADTARCRLTVLCDSDPMKAAALATITDGAPLVIDDWRAAIVHEEVDAVIIATTTSTHAEIAVAAARAGRHILVEKPMATTVEDCQAIELAVAEHHVLSMIGFKFRFAPAVVEAKRLVTQPIVVTAHTMYDADQDVSSWVNDPLLSGGRVTSSLVHAVDLLRYLTGAEIERVHAEGGNLAIREHDEPDNVVITLRFETGAIGSIVHGSAGRSGLLSTWSFQTIGVGQNATIHDHGRRMVLHSVGADDSTFSDPVPDSFQVGMREMLDSFAASIDNGVVASSTARDGTISVVACEAITRSIATGEPQTVSLSD